MTEHADVTYRIEVRMGDPVEEIIKEAGAGGYDLIVMGSHGHGPIRTAMMGDTVRRIVRQSTVPVLVVRVPEDH